jgi:hypothetical protein
MDWKNKSFNEKWLIIFNIVFFGFVFFANFDAFFEMLIGLTIFLIASYIITRVLFWK